MLCLNSFTTDILYNMPYIYYTYNHILYHTLYTILYYTYIDDRGRPDLPRVSHYPTRPTESATGRL